jgi:hypothetical protein
MMARCSSSLRASSSLSASQAAELDQEQSGSDTWAMELTIPHRLRRLMSNRCLVTASQSTSVSRIFRLISHLGPEPTMEPLNYPQLDRSGIGTNQ